MYDGMSAVKREKICRLTGTIRIATRGDQQPVEKAVVAVDEFAHWGSRVVRAASDKKRPAQDSILAPAALPELHRVDLVVDVRRADFLRVIGHHRIGELLHLRAVGERDPLQPPGLFHRVELLLVGARLDLAAEDAGFLAGLDDRRPAGRAAAS